MTSIERMRVATSSSTLRPRRSVHPTVAHTVDTLLLAERTNWAIHIHDGLTQSVTSAILELQGLQHRIRTEPEIVLATLKEIEDAIRNDLKQIREILFELDAGTPHREPPLATFVSDLVQRWHLPARVSIEGEVDRIDDLTLETANAIVAEALANAAKHSGAPEVSVRIIAGLRGAPDRGRGPRQRRGRARGRDALRTAPDAQPSRTDRRHHRDRFEARKRHPRGRRAPRRRAR